jgi:Flp pilus assembly pilin Flp
MLKTSIIVENECGQDLVEYALVVGIIALEAIAVECIELRRKCD